jgi:hypothetical protein
MPANHPGGHVHPGGFAGDARRDRSQVSAGSRIVDTADGATLPRGAAGLRFARHIRVIEDRTVPAPPSSPSWRLAARGLRAVCDSTQWTGDAGTGSHDSRVRSAAGKRPGENQSMLTKIASIAAASRDPEPLHDVPCAADLRGRADLARIDYADSQVATAGPDSAAAEARMRQVFEDASLPLRLFLRFGWQLLGARLGPSGKPGHILGWQITHNDSRWIRLRTDWRIGLTANLVLCAASDSRTVATFVELHNVFARAIWKMLVPLHRLILRGSLRRIA